MTGMIHNIHEICPDCRQTANPQDWTCTQCGLVLDRFLFGTVTQKSVSGADKEAFLAGAEACASQWREIGSVELRVHRPVRGHENAYRAGWHNAAQRIEGKGERKRGRRRGV